jgi:hypothetical protein
MAGRARTRDRVATIVACHLVRDAPREGGHSEAPRGGPPQPLYGGERPARGNASHSAPGGYSGALLYDFDLERGGCDEATVACIPDGCAHAVEMADANLA